MQMKNFEVARILRNISILLDMDDVPFKPRAYEKAALSIEALEEDVEQIYQKGGLKALKQIPGVGESIAEKIEEIISSQKKTLVNLKKEYEEDKRAGELIYENYNEIKNILSAFEEAKKKMTLAEIKSKIKNKKIVSIENSKIVVDL